MKCRLALAGAFVLLVTGPVQAEQLRSSWRQADVRVDGVADEWGSRFVALPSVPIDAAVQNDDAYLYVCLRTKDDATKKQLLGVGLSLYLDATGKEDRAFGVRFPVGRLAARDTPDTGDAEMSRALELSVAGGEVMILGLEDVGRMRVAEALPLQTALGEQETALVLEFRVPLGFSVDTP
ncbi:MAG: hypothetical protein ABIT01_16405, partial [Thermoanaerobaculia bacterium]